MNEPYKRNEAALFLSALLSKSSSTIQEAVEFAIFAAKKFEAAHKKNAPFNYFMLPEVSAEDTVGEFKAVGHEVYFYNGETETYICRFENEVQATAYAIAQNTILGDYPEPEELVTVLFRVPCQTECSEVKVPRSMATATKAEIMNYLFHQMEAVDLRSSETVARPSCDFNDRLGGGHD